MADERDRWRLDRSVERLDHRDIRTTDERSSTLRQHTLGALGGPLYLLIWICGGYLALAPLTASVSAPQRIGMLLDFMHTLLNLGVFAVAFWSCFRFTRVLEARLSAWAARTSGRFDSSARKGTQAPALQRTAA